MSKKLGLLVIDAQEDFLSDPNLTPNKIELVDAIHGLLSWARSKSIPVFHIRTIIAKDGSDAMPHWQAAGQFKCQNGSRGADSPLLLQSLPDELVFTKQFFNAFDNPNFIDALNAKNIETLIITGVHTHACIREAAVSAYARGFQAIIPTDAVGSYDELHASITLKWLNGRAATCMASKKIISDWEQPRLSKTKTLSWSHHNPCNADDILFEIPLQQECEIESIAKSVHIAQNAWGRMPIAERAIRLKEWLTILMAQKQLWINTLILDLGKPFVDALGEVNYGLNLLENICISLIDSEAFSNSQVAYRPHGTVTLITPWNNPFAIPISKIGPAIGFGNSVLWKPALPASRLSQLLMQSLIDAGLANLVGLVTGGASAGQLLIESKYTAAVSFTGSVSTGQKIANTSKISYKPLQAELGGNNAAIVLRDADIDYVAQDLATAIFSFAGQRCTAIRRVIVDSEIESEFSLAFKKAIGSLRVGNPSDPETQVGPVINSGHKDYLLNEIECERRMGTKVLGDIATPKNLSIKGNWLMPTVLVNPSMNSTIWKEEMFGPVVALQKSHDINSAIELHNGVGYGLLGVLYSDNELHKKYFLQEAQAGLLSINRARPLFSISGPFYGWKLSGIGIPEHGRWNRDFYTRVQAIYQP